MRDLADIKAQIFQLLREYTHVEQCQPHLLSDARQIKYAGRIYDDAERLNLFDSALDFWLTAGKYAELFEKRLAEYLSIPYAYAVNSGSSANLLAFSALMSPLLGDKRLICGDEVITVAMGFPTTVAPIVQLGCIPVFVDVTLPSYNIDIAKMESALTERTRAVFIAHTLGNVFDLKSVSDFCTEHNLFLIEDNCDALGAEYNMGDGFRKTGTFGDIGTSSFYPAHHITMGEGGAVYTKNPLFARILLSIRDWGRDCVCPPGEDDTCGCRFDGQFASLPIGYDHKYVYSHLGFNFKITDMQAAIGCAQLEKLPGFVEKRRSNWKSLRDALYDLDEFLILPEENTSSLHSPFGFVVTLRESSPLSRIQLAEFLELAGVQTRMLFAGNITRQPCFAHLRENVDFRICGSLVNTDMIMNNSLWTGVYPGLTDSDIDRMISAFRAAFGL